MTIRDIFEKYWYLIFGLFIVLYIPQMLQVAPLIASGGSDFACHYLAGKILLAGEGSNFYSIETQKLFSPVSEANKEALFLPYLHLPFEALIQIPTSMLSYKVAFFVWNIISLFFLGASVYIFVDLLKPDKLTFFSFKRLFIVALAFLPTVTNLLNGQDSSVFLFLIVFSLLLARNKKMLFSGMILGLGVAKPHLVIPIALCYSILYGRQFFIGFFLSSLMCGLTCLALVGGMDGMLQGLELIKTVNADPSFGVHGALFPNFRGLFERLHFPMHENLAVISWVLGLLAIGISTYKNKSADLVRQLSLISISILITILISFHFNSHDFLILIVPLFLGVYLLENKKEFFVQDKLLLTMLILYFTPIMFNIDLMLPFLELSILSTFTLIWTFSKNLKSM